GRGAEGDEPADAAPVAELDEVAGDETAEAVANDVHPRGALVSADLLDPPGEPGDEALVVDAGRVGEAREVSGRHGSPGSCAGGGSSTGHPRGPGRGRRGLDGGPVGRSRRAPAGRAAARRRAGPSAP